MSEILSEQYSSVFSEASHCIYGNTLIFKAAHYQYCQATS